MRPDHYQKTMPLHDNTSNMKVLVTGGSGFIGTHLVDLLLDGGHEVCNLDIAAPNMRTHDDCWRSCDILEPHQLNKHFAAFQPSHVVHLAARVDTDSSKVSDYHVNTDGTANVLDAIRKIPGITRVVITSTQFVCSPGHPPSHDEEYSPHTAYGQSKVISEKLTRAAALEADWTIIRPTNVWGPWHPRYPHEFWKVLREGRYVHPGRQPVTRSYGYVKNVVYQISRILEAPAEQVGGRVFYVGDRPIELLDYVNGFARAINGRDVRIVPRSLVRGLALAGDVAGTFGLPFPIRSSRFRSMTEDDPTPMEPIMDAFGEPPYTMEAGIRETADWLKTEYPA